MEPVYPQVTIELVRCQHYDLAGNRCTAAPIASIRHGGNPEAFVPLIDGPFCEEHLRKALDFAESGPMKMVVCSMPTNEGRSCNAPPIHRHGGVAYCAAHYRKALLQESGLND